MPPRGRCACLALAAASLALASGCAGSAPNPASPYAPLTEVQRDPAKAQRLTMQAADLITCGQKLDEAETLLREAVTADLYHGPAHNNLGVLYLKQHLLYQAASEFEWAARLLPGAGDPRHNLALTLEQAGRTDDALSTYKTALEACPGHLASMEALARLQVRSGKTDDKTPELLKEIAMRGEDESWRLWARSQMTLAGPSVPP